MSRRRTLKFRANHLLLVAGPPTSGKSTLLAGIANGSLSTLREQLAFGDPRTWTVVNATSLYNVEGPLVDRLVVHYDLLAQRTPTGFRNVTELIDRAGDLVILTLWTDAESLRARNWARIVEGVSTFPLRPSQARQRIFRLRRLWRRHRVFRSRDRVLQLYREWLGVASKYPSAPHWIVNSTTVAGTASAQTLEAARTGLLAELSQ